MAYTVHFAFFPKWSGTGELDSRMLLVLALQTLWSARLTTNTYRRGFFNPYVLYSFQPFCQGNVADDSYVESRSSEDYRWEIVRAKIPVWQFKLSPCISLSRSSVGKACL